MNYQFDEATQFLRDKGLIKDYATTFIISGDFGQINLAELLEEYALIYRDNHDQGVWGQKEG